MRTKKTFTLIEVLVVLAVFSFVIMGATRALISVQQSWARQKQKIALIQDSRWFMEKLGLELHFGSDNKTSGGKLKITGNNPERLAFGFDLNRNDQLDLGGAETDDREYWYFCGTGNGPHGGEPGVLYKGSERNFGQSHVNLDDAEKVVYNLCITDESGNNYDFFADKDNTDEDDGLVTVNLILRPYPEEEDAPRNRSFHLLTKIRARNTGDD